MSRKSRRGASELVGTWLSDYLPNVRMLSEGTIDSYETAIQLYHSYLKETGGAQGDAAVKAKGIFAAGIEHFNAGNLMCFVEWLATERNNKSRTIRQRLAAIKSFLSYAAITDMSNAAVFAQATGVKVGRKEPDRLVGHMTEEEWDAVAAQPNIEKRTELRNWVFMILMYEIAGRNQEVIGLRVKDLVLKGDNPRVYVHGKGNKDGVTPIRARVAAILSDYIARFHPERDCQDDPLFYIRRKGEKCFMSPDCPEAFLKRYGEMAREQCPSVPARVHPHLIRHTRAMHLKESGMSDEELAAFLRHSGLGTVKVYAQASAQSKRKAIEKANGKDPSAPKRKGSWENDAEMIRRLRHPND